MRILVDMLHSEGCSLVVRDSRGEVTLYYKKGVRDLENLLDHAPERLKGAVVADKVIGKAAAGMMAYGGIKAAYGDVVSLGALAVLENAGVECTFGETVERIVVPEGDTRCRLEDIVGEAMEPLKIVARLRLHFKEMEMKQL